MDACQNVEIDLVFLKQSQAPHHPVEGGLASLVHPVGIVQFTRAIEANPY